MIGFQGQKAEPVEALANRLNRLGNWSTIVLLHFFKVLHILASRDQFGQDIGLIVGLGLDFETIGG